MFYKYKRFDHQTLELLITDRLFFADPLTFNDPLDTRPSVDGDLPNTDLREILRRLIEQRTFAEMTAAAQSLKYRGPKTDLTDILNQRDREFIASVRPVPEV
jgi:hypothetical protein